MYSFHEISVYSFYYILLTSRRISTTIHERRRGHGPRIAEIAPFPGTLRSSGFPRPWHEQCSSTTTMDSVPPGGKAPSNTPAQPDRDIERRAQPTRDEADDRAARASRRREIIVSAIMLAILVLIAALILAVMNNAMNATPLFEHCTAAR
jgi:hypothetical protein